MDLLTRGHVSHITLFISGAAEKEKFIRLADEDKDRYLEEMKVWEAKQRGVTLKASKVRIGKQCSSWSVVKPDTYLYLLTLWIPITWMSRTLLNFVVICNKVLYLFEFL